MSRKTNAEIAIALTLGVAGQAVVPPLRPMPVSDCVINTHNDFGRPAGCDDSPLAPRAAIAVTVASSTTSSYFLYVKIDAVTDAEYETGFPGQSGPADRV